MNARGLGCTGLEYLDSIDLKIHKKPTTGMMQFWGIGNVNSDVNSGSVAQHIRSANREAIITCRGNLLQHVAVAHGLSFSFDSRKNIMLMCSTC